MEIIPYIIGTIILGLPISFCISSYIKYKIDTNRLEKYRPKFHEQMNIMDKIIHTMSKNYTNDYSADTFFNLRSSISLSHKVNDIPLRSVNNSEEHIEKRYEQRQEMINKFIINNRKYLKGYYREERLKQLLDE